jgi:hypothetical protein
MNILTNEKTIRRNAAIGKYVSMVAFGLMLIGMYFSFQFGDPNFAVQNESYTLWMGLSLFVGFILFQIGTYFMNRFGRRPRPDEMLAASLKGFSKDYTLYHYLTPVNHLLVGPAGVWILEPYYQRGTITYQEGKADDSETSVVPKHGRWQQKGGGILLGYMKIFGQEGLGRPDLEVKADIDGLNEEFKKALGEHAPPVNAILVFTDPRAELAADNAPLPTLKLKELKEFLRKYAKEHPFPAEQIKRVTAVLPEESVE